MSGGSHDYVYCKIENELCGQMHDPELNELMSDISELAHYLEWWESGDIGEESYRKTVCKFKRKWFQSSREERLKKYVDEALERQKVELYKMIETRKGGSPK